MGMAPSLSPDLAFSFAAFELLLDGFFALLHFGFDELFDLVNLEKAFGVSSC